MRTVGIKDGKVFWVLTYAGDTDDLASLAKEMENDIEALRKEFGKISPLF